MPPIPSGFSALWPGPATKPSSDIEILNRSFAMTGLPRNRSMIRVAPVALPMAAVPAAEGEPTMTVDTGIAKKSGHLEIRGVRYYYELRGHGEPLLLLHGGLGSIDMFGPMADQMKETPMYKSYMAVAPNPADFPKLLDR